MKTTKILKYIGGVKKNLRRDLVIIGKSVYITDDNEEDVRNEKKFKCFELSKRLDGENETENADLNWRFCQVLVQVSADC